MIYGDAGDDELEGNEGNDQLMYGGAGDDEIDRLGRRRHQLRRRRRTTSSSSSTPVLQRPTRPSRVQDRVTDFQGAGVAGGDVIDTGQRRRHRVRRPADYQPEDRRGPARRRQRASRTWSTPSQGGNTWLIADINDDGRARRRRLRGPVRRHPQFHRRMTSTSTDFVIVGTDGDDVITGTEGDDQIFALGGNDQVFALGGERRGPRRHRRRLHRRRHRRIRSTCSATKATTR